jgi:hypothetical protein
MQDGVERPIAYCSRHLNETERRYHTTHRELLAVKDGVMHYRMFLQERPFTIYTDHQPLIALLKKSIIEDSRTQRWIWTIQEYSFELKYRKGPDNANADGLSRLPIANPPPSASLVVTHTVGAPTSKKARVKTHIYAKIAVSCTRI